MTTNKDRQPDERPEGDEDPTTAEGASQSRGDETTEAHDGQVAAMIKEIDHLKDQLLRSAADYQNMARRSQQSIAEARQQQLASIAKALVSVLDHFDLALAVDTEKVSAQSLLQGVKMVYDELFKMLDQFGVERMKVQAGDEFDPKRHEALMRQKAEGIPSGRVAGVFQSGYTLHDRTLRPAQVSVSE